MVIKAPKARTAAECERLEQLPNIGPSLAADLRRIGIERPVDLHGQDAFALYRRCARRPASARTRACSTPSWPPPTSCAAPPPRRGGNTRPSARRPSARSEPVAASERPPWAAFSRLRPAAPRNNRHAGSCRRTPRRAFVPFLLPLARCAGEAGASPGRSWCPRSAGARRTRALAAARLDFAEALYDVRTAGAAAPLAHRRRPLAARAVALREEVFSRVACRHDQAQAERRLAELDLHFPRRERSIHRRRGTERCRAARRQARLRRPSRARPPRKSVLPSSRRCGAAARRSS